MSSARRASDGLANVRYEIRGKLARIGLRCVIRSRIHELAPAVAGNLVIWSRFFELRRRERTVRLGICAARTKYAARRKACAGGDRFAGDQRHARRRPRGIRNRRQECSRIRMPGCREQYVARRYVRKVQS